MAHAGSPATGLRAQGDGGGRGKQAARSPDSWYKPAYALPLAGVDPGAITVKNQKQAMLYGTATVLLWSTVATAFKLALADLAPMQMLLVACVASIVVMGGALVIMGRWQEVFQLSRRQYLQSIGMGLINPCLYYFLLFGAFDRLPAQEAQPLNYTWALVLAYLSVPFLGQKLRRIDILAGLVCYAGVVVIATRGAVTSLSFSDPLGVSLALGSTVVWASYWIIA